MCPAVNPLARALCALSLAATAAVAAAQVGASRFTLGIVFDLRGQKVILVAWAPY